jgi:hypothetical protein
MQTTLASTHRETHSSHSSMRDLSSRKMLKSEIRERQEELLAIVEIYTETMNVLKHLKQGHTPKELMLDYIEGQIQLMECHENKYQLHYCKKLKLLLKEYAESGILLLD